MSRSVRARRCCSTRSIATDRSPPPGADTVAYRISGVVTRRDGTIVNGVTGELYNEIQNETICGQLPWKPNDMVRTRPIVDYTSLAGDCCTQMFLRIGASRRTAAQRSPAGR